LPCLHREALCGEEERGKKGEEGEDDEGSNKTESLSTYPISMGFCRVVFYVILIFKA
jgi:hypothetical protein